MVGASIAKSPIGAPIVVGASWATFATDGAAGAGAAEARDGIAGAGIAGIGAADVTAGIAEAGSAGAAASAVEPQVDNEGAAGEEAAAEPHVGCEGAAGCAVARPVAPHVGPEALIGIDDVGENVTGSDEIARGLVNGMTLLALTGAGSGAGCDD